MIAASLFALTLNWFLPMPLTTSSSSAINRHPGIEWQHRVVAEMYNVDPKMFASVAAGSVVVTEGALVVATVTMTDQDTWKFTSPDGATYGLLMGNPTVGATLQSGDSTGAMYAMTSRNDNTGQLVITVAHIAASLPDGSTSMIYLDAYPVSDDATDLIKDPGMVLGQLVQVNKKP